VFGSHILININYFFIWNELYFFIKLYQLD